MYYIVSRGTGLIPDNDVPSQPNAVPPQATLSNSEYTPAQARAQV